NDTDVRLRNRHGAHRDRSLRQNRDGVVPRLKDQPLEDTSHDPDVWRVRIDHTDQQAIEKLDPFAFERTDVVKAEECVGVQPMDLLTLELVQIHGLHDFQHSM
ncbi:MAG TPA: hypothetical protein VGO00_05985, partial [Kofleriaceae bacterium]|nr:hypothetical protein [Kofleriaceae bacterium]